MKTKKSKKRNRKPVSFDDWCVNCREMHAENRRKLLKKLSPKAREIAIQDFARLGLYQ